MLFFLVFTTEAPINLLFWLYWKIDLLFQNQKNPHPTRKKCLKGINTFDATPAFPWNSVYHFQKEPSAAIGLKWYGVFSTFCFAFRFKSVFIPSFIEKRFIIKEIRCEVKNGLVCWNLHAQEISFGIFHYENVICCIRYLKIDFKTDIKLNFFKPSNVFLFIHLFILISSYLSVYIYLSFYSYLALLVCSFLGI